VSEQSTAYHEAGHAVMAIDRQVPFNTVSIIPDDDSWGRVMSRPLPGSFQPDINTDARTRRFIENRVMVMYAGGLAQVMILDKEPEGTSQDNEVTVLLADYLIGGPQELEAYLSWLYVRVASALSMPWSHLAIGKNADLLLDERELKQSRVLRAWRSPSTRPSTPPGTSTRPASARSTCRWAHRSTIRLM